MESRTSLLRGTCAAPDLPEDVLALLDHHLLDLGGTYGDRTRATRFSTTNYVTGGPAVLGWALVSAPSPTGT